MPYVQLILRMCQVCSVLCYVALYVGLHRRTLLWVWKSLFTAYWQTACPEKG